MDAQTHRHDRVKALIALAELSYADTAEILGVSVDRLRNWTKPPSTSGSARSISDADLELLEVLAHGVDPVAVAADLNRVAKQVEAMKSTDNDTMRVCLSALRFLKTLDSIRY